MVKTHIGRAIYFLDRWCRKLNWKAI